MKGSVFFSTNQISPVVLLWEEFASGSQGSLPSHNIREYGGGEQLNEPARYCAGFRKINGSNCLKAVFCR